MQRKRIRIEPRAFKYMIRTIYGSIIQDQMKSQTFLKIKPKKRASLFKKIRVIIKSFASLKGFRVPKDVGALN